MLISGAEKRFDPADYEMLKQTRCFDLQSIVFEVDKLKAGQVTEIHKKDALGNKWIGYFRKDENGDVLLQHLIVRDDIKRTGTRQSAQSAAELPSGQRGSTRKRPGSANRLDRGLASAIKRKRSIDVFRDTDSDMDPSSSHTA